MHPMFKQAPISHRPALDVKPPISRWPAPALMPIPPLAWEDMVPLQARNAYLIAADRREDADTLCCQILAMQRGDEHATLVSLNVDPATVIVELPDDTGPGELRLYRLDAPARSAFKALSTLAHTLARKLCFRHRLLILTAPASSWDDCSHAQLRTWLDAFAVVLRDTECRLLILAHGHHAASLSTRVRALHDSLAGLAELRRERDYAYYQIRHWRSAEGVTSARQLLVTSGPDRKFKVVLHSAPPRPMECIDSDVCLAEVSALGCPPLSPPFTVAFEDAQKLSSRALMARAATIIFSLADPARIPRLARQLHRLRRERGSALKLVVREIAPCLRYPDEQTLLACGASLIVPYGLGNTRFLALLESIQGQTHVRPLVTDPEMLLAQRSPLLQRGQFPAPVFAHHAATMMARPAPNGERGALLSLRPVSGLTPQHALDQCRLRRYGDLACIDGNRLFLYLFDGHAQTAAQTLHAMFRLPWAPLFDDWHWFTDPDEMQAQLDLLHRIDTTAGATECPAHEGAPTDATTPARRTPVRQALLH